MDIITLRFEICKPLVVSISGLSIKSHDVK